MLGSHAAEVLRAKLSSDATAEAFSGLTGRERALLTLLGEGLTNRQIAERMFLAEKTVKNYVSRLLTKLGLQRRTQAAILVTRTNPSPPRVISPARGSDVQ